jgi:hypothetical protein
MNSKQAKVNLKNKILFGFMPYPLRIILLLVLTGLLTYYAKFKEPVYQYPQKHGFSGWILPHPSGLAVMFMDKNDGLENFTENGCQVWINPPPNVTTLWEQKIRWRSTCMIVIADTLYPTPLSVLDSFLHPDTLYQRTWVGVLPPNALDSLPNSTRLLNLPSLGEFIQIEIDSSKFLTIYQDSLAAFHYHIAVPDFPLAIEPSLNGYFSSQEPVSLRIISHILPHTQLHSTSTSTPTVVYSPGFPLNDSEPQGFIIIHQNEQGALFTENTFRTKEWLLRKIHLRGWIPE